MRKVFLLALWITLTLNTPFAWQQKYRNRDGVDGNILLGHHYAFILAEPNGWDMDAPAGKPNGLDAVLYPDGTSFDKAVAVMYVRVVHKDLKIKKSLKHVIENDIKEFKQRNKQSTVTGMPAQVTRDKKKAELRYFYDAENQNYEMVAYIGEAKVVSILVLTSRNKEEYAKSVAAFKDLVASYFFVNELVNVR